VIYLYPSADLAMPQFIYVYFGKQCTMCTGLMIQYTLTIKVWVVWKTTHGLWDQCLLVLYSWSSHRFVLHMCLQYTLILQGWGCCNLAPNLWPYDPPIRGTQPGTYVMILSQCWRDAMHYIQPYIVIMNHTHQYTGLDDAEKRFYCNIWYCVTMFRAVI